MCWGPRQGVSAMRRSSRSPRGLQGDSRLTAHATGRTPKTSSSKNLIAVPDGGRQLSEGLLIEAFIVARLLRIRLLVIDASLIVAPAKVTGRTRAAAHTAHESFAQVPPRTRAGGTIGAGLAAADRFLGEAAASLAASRAASR